jgi:hypothetical protein
MFDLCKLIFGMVIDLLRSRAALEAEILVLRQQINVLRRASSKRPPFISIDRLILGGVCRLFPKMYDALAIVRPDTVIRWHRAGFRTYWRWKSRRRCGRPTVPLEMRRLIPRDEHRQPVMGCCVKKTRECHAVRKMKEDPSEPSCRGRLQTAISCFGQKPRW